MLGNEVYNSFTDYTRYVKLKHDTRLNIFGAAAFHLEQSCSFYADIFHSRPHSRYTVGNGFPSSELCSKVYGSVHINDRSKSLGARAVAQGAITPLITEGSSKILELHL